MSDTDAVTRLVNMSRPLMLSCGLHTKTYLCLSISDKNFSPRHDSWNHLPHSGKSQPIQCVVDGGLKVGLMAAIDCRLSGIVDYLGL